MFKVKLGAKAKDKITGIEGIVTGRAEYLLGSNKYFIDGNSEDQWTDEENIEIIF